LVAFRAVTALVMGFAQAELAGPLSVAAREPAAETIARFRALPRDRYRRLIEIATAARTSSAEREFRDGLALLLDGLDRAWAARVKSGRPSSPRRPRAGRAGSRRARACRRAARRPSRRAGRPGSRTRAARSARPRPGSSRSSRTGRAARPPETTCRR